MVRHGFAALVALAVLSPLASADPPHDSPKLPRVQENELTGKVVCIETKEAEKSAWVKDVRITHLGGRSFLVGNLTLPSEMKVDRPEITYWFPVDDLKMLTVYNNVEDAAKALRSWHEYKKKYESLRQTESLPGARP
jgi:hypothetical protein